MTNSLEKELAVIVNITAKVNDVNQWFSTFSHQRTGKKRKNFLRTSSTQSQ